MLMGWAWQDRAAVSSASLLWHAAVATTGGPGCRVGRKTAGRQCQRPAEGGVKSIGQSGLWTRHAAAQRQAGGAQH